MRVFVYRNLHQKCWSIKSREPDYKYDLVLGHAMNVDLICCKFVVGEKGRERVVNEKRKNVHAGIVGELLGFTPNRLHRELDTSLEHYVRLTTSVKDLPEVSYNPYFAPYFFYVETDTPIHEANMVYLTTDMKAYVYVDPDQ